MIRRARLPGAFALAASIACASGAPETRPVPTLSTDVRAARAFDPLREAWAHATDEDRQGLRSELAAFISSFPGDDLARLAGLYLVLSWMSPPADFPRAEALLKALPEPPPGTLHDLYAIAQAKSLRHHGDAQAAFDRLRPIIGKLVDPTARALLEEEVSLDAIEAHRDYEAIAYMDAWLRGASEAERDAVRTKVARVLLGLSEQTLRGALQAMRVKTSGSLGYGLEIQRLIAERLASIAVSRNDAALARWLVESSSGGAAVRGDAGVALSELATSKRGLGNVVGRTVGLVLTTDTPGLRAEAADVARGMAWALSLPRARDQEGDRIRLVTRDDGGERERLVPSLEEIAGEGAAVIITGLDGPSADRAIEWAENKPIALVVLATPSRRKPGDFTFVLGQSLAPAVEALAAALAAKSGGRGLIAPVVDGDRERVFVEGFSFDTGASFRAPISCDVEAARAGERRFPVESWAAAGVKAWLLATSPECATDVVHEVSTRIPGATFGMTLEAAGALDSPAPSFRGRILSAAAGIVPLWSAPAGDPRLVEARAMLTQLSGRPSFWVALGRDAGALVRGALATQPLDTVTDRAEIALRRRSARDALAAARAPLWTSDAQGFEPAEGGFFVRRSVRVAEAR